MSFFPQTTPSYFLREALKRSEQENISKQSIPICTPILSLSLFCTWVRNLSKTFLQYFFLRLLKVPLFYNLFQPLQPEGLWLNILLIAFILMSLAQGASHGLGLLTLETFVTISRLKKSEKRNYEWVNVLLKYLDFRRELRWF